jgi:phage terminase large subunit GpA-like protein
VNLHDGYDEAVRAVAEAMTPDPELHLDVWAEANVVLPKGSPFPGNYRLSHTPYARRILQCLSPGHPASTVVAMVASQMLKTQSFICAALGWIDRAPGNILALEPSDKLAKRLSSRVSKAIAGCDAVRDKVAKPRSRDNRNTIDCKEFDGGEMHIVTSGSANNLAEMSARYLFGDEVDRQQVIPNEGHPVDISLARLTQFKGISKAYLVSTPLVLGFSKIHSLFNQGTRESYHVPCPHCGHLHALQRDNFRYDYDPDLRRVSRAWFVCPECGSEIEEHHKTTMLPELGYGGQARWVAESLGDGETISVWLPAYYAPLGTITWLDLALQLARAIEREKIGDPEGMRAYVNTREGLPYDGTDQSTTAERLMARAEPYPPRTIPDQALVVTMFADVQRTWLEVTIEAWGPGLQHWVLDHTRLWGSHTVSPETPGSVWQQLTELRNTPLQHESGVLIPISAFGVDSGDGDGSHQDVYNYAYLTEHLGCLATKGASVRYRPIIAGTPTKVDVDWKGQRVAEGVKLWMLGTDTAKDHLLNRMLLKDGPGSMHFHQGLALEFYQQLLVERPQTTWRKGKPVREYIKPNGARNEVLDCSVGNLSVAHYLGLHRWAAADWARLRERLIPKQITPDLFAGLPALPAPATPSAPSAPPVRPAQPQAAETPTPPPQPQPAEPPAPPPVAIATPAPEPSGRRIYSRGI